MSSSALARATLQELVNRPGAELRQGSDGGMQRPDSHLLGLVAVVLLAV